MEDVIHEGITYKAVDEKEIGSCLGCAFHSWCRDPVPCNYQSVIFVKKEEPEEVFDPPEYTYNGEVYLPKGSEGCIGCAFIGVSEGCLRAPCIDWNRKDNKPVIFIRKPDTAPLKPSEPIKPVRLRRRIIIPD